MIIRPNNNALFNSTISLKITDNQIKRHIKECGIKELKDVRCSLYLRFNTARTGGSWWLYQYKEGKRIKHRLGHYPTTKAKHIMELVSAASVNIAQQNKVDCNKFETITQLLDWYLKREEATNKSKKERVNSIRSIIDKHLISLLGHVKLTEVDHLVIDTNVIQWMFSHGYSVAYVRGVFNVLKTAFATAKRLKIINSNYISDVKFISFFPDGFSLTKAQLKGCKLSNGELKEVFDTLDHSAFRVRMLIMLMLGHGARLGETRQARWKDISLIDMIWFIPGDKTKNSCDMVYPISTLMANLLQAYQCYQLSNGYSGQYLFPISYRINRPVYASLASKWVRDVSSQRWSAHDLRKRAKSIWLDLGVDYFVCKALLNHTQGSLDQAYIHTHLEKQKRKALEDYHMYLNNHWRTALTPPLAA